MISIPLSSGANSVMASQVQSYSLTRGFLDFWFTHGISCDRLHGHYQIVEQVQESLKIHRGILILVLGETARLFL